MIPTSWSGSEQRVDLDGALSALAQICHVAGDPPRVTLHELARIATEALQVERFGVWCVTDDRTAIRLYFHYSRSTGAVADGTILRRDDFPGYFRARHVRTIVIEDVNTDPAAADLLEPYLRPLGIGALLDAPIYVEGVESGVVCHEHVGGPRCWTPEERLFVGVVADNVSRLVEEFLRQRAEQSLRVYQRELQDLNRLEGMGRMAAGIAHDFRNLLTVVSANAELMGHDPMTAEQQKSMEQILLAARQGRELAKELMHFGHDSTERPTVQALRPVLDALIAMAAPSLLPCTVEVHQDTEVSRVLIDRSELERVLLNLLRNAKDAMQGEGVIPIEVTQARGDRKTAGIGRAVCIAVVDSGVGMDADARLRLFEPFYTTKPDGTGLGLAVARQIVTRAGGTIEVDSTPGVGTKMRVILPAIE
jgi:signal transduction histidine kinase